MKSFCFIITCLFITTLVLCQHDKAIFLHHSTGGAVYDAGNVSQWIADYNSNHGTSYSIEKLAYPNTPWPWNNYPYDYWKLWVDGSCNNTQVGTQCPDQLVENYELIIFKHCFPGAGINDDSSQGNISSSVKTIPNYKLQYRALLDLLDQYPDTKFMIWTLAPLHRNATNTQQAQRAAEFTHWVKNTWLHENGQNHPNVFIFDFFGLAAEQSESPVNGVQYCLKYDYEKDHNGSDSHPNTLANTTIGPIFAESVTEVLTIDLSAIIEESSGPPKLFVNISNYDLFYHIQGTKQATPYFIELYSITGQRIYAFETTNHKGSFVLNERGLYIIRVKTEKEYLSQKIVL